MIQVAINTDKYPINDLQCAKSQMLIQQGQAQLRQDGLFVLKGFVVEEYVKQIINETEDQFPNAFFKQKHHNPYLLADDENYSKRHPRNFSQTTSSATLAYDYIPKQSLINQLYQWPELHHFLATVLGFEQLHPYADPLASLNMLIYPPNTKLSWHFDNANFVVTLTLQLAQSGGVYEYAPFIRSEAEENFDLVNEVLSGKTDRVKVLQQSIGDLVIFQGRNTLHRVTEITGETSRLMAVFSYDPEPGKMLAAHTQQTFYGRTSH